MKRDLLSCSVIFFLNVVDTTFTWYWKTIGVEEGNPLLYYFFQSGLLPFVASKMGLVLFGLLVLWVFREHPLTQTGFLILISYYNLLTFYHVYSFWSWNTHGQIKLAILL